MACLKEAVEPSVTATALLLKTLCAVGKHPLRHRYLVSKAILIHCIHFLLHMSILVRVERAELSVLVLWGYTIISYPNTMHFLIFFVIYLITRSFIKAGQSVIFFFLIVLVFLAV